VTHSAQRMTAHLLYEGLDDFLVLYRKMRCGEYMRRGLDAALQQLLIPYGRRYSQLGAAAGRCSSHTVFLTIWRTGIDIAGQAAHDRLLSVAVAV
jgi:hypothetical protein